MFMIALLLSLYVLSGDFTTTAQDYKDAAFVGLTKSTNTSSNPLLYDYVELDVRGSYDTRGGKFYPFKAGSYWVSISMGALPGKRSQGRLRRPGDDCYAGAVTHTTTHNGFDTRSRDAIVPLNQYQTIQMYNVYAAFSDQGLQTSLSIFRLEFPVFFSATRTQSLTATKDLTLPFTLVYANEGGGFDPKTSIFKAPRNGYYFLSFGAAPDKGTAFDSELRRNAALLTSLESRSTTSNHICSLNRGGLFYLFENDSIYVTLKKGSTVFDSAHHWTSFSGFLYEPVHGTKRAWSVMRTTSWEGTRNLSPITFDKVQVSIGSGWNEPLNTYVCNVAGVYYITFTVGAQAGKHADVMLMVDGKEKASITRTMTSHNGMELLSRSAVLFLESRSRVYLEAIGHTAFYSDSEGQTSFTGLLLFPHSV